MFECEQQTLFPFPLQSFSLRGAARCKATLVYGGVRPPTRDLRGLYSLLSRGISILSDYSLYAIRVMLLLSVIFTSGLQITTSQHSYTRSSAAFSFQSGASPSLSLLLLLLCTMHIDINSTPVF
jgi:hypothetical protein